MKRVLSVIGIIVLVITMTSSSVVVYPTKKTFSYTSGEYLRYRVSYGIMDAGEAVLTVNETKVKGAGMRPLYHVKGTGRTLGAFNWFFKVDDTYESYVDKQGSFPWKFVRDVNEGGYIIKQTYTFYQNKQKVVTQDQKSYKIPLGVQDMISSFYYARTLDFNKMKAGDIITFNVFLDDEVLPLNIRYMGKDEVKIRKGKFKALKFQPVVYEGRVFKNEEDVQFWVTDDINRIPILVKAKIAVGSVKLHLVEWKGLKGPISQI